MQHVQASTSPAAPAAAGAAHWPVVSAPPAWSAVDFISDLHLNAADEATFLAWQHYLAHTSAQAVFILGDLFDVWVGDDVIDAAPPPQPAAAPDGFEARCARVLAEASRHRALYFMRGNRDFLLGPAFARSCGMQLLHDPAVLAFGGRRWLLSHGDALCLDDTEYMQFRAQVRGAGWQQAFLARPLPERQAIARDLRARSEARKQALTTWADVDAAAARAWLAAAMAPVLIHGHTHRPADHVLGDGCQRWVLSDWDAGASPPRAQVLRVRVDNATGPARPQRLAAASA